MTTKKVKLHFKKTVLTEIPCEDENVGVTIGELNDFMEKWFYKNFGESYREMELDEIEFLE